MKLLKHSSDKIFYETKRYIRENKLTIDNCRISTQYFIFFNPSLTYYSSTKNKKKKESAQNPNKKEKRKRKLEKTLKYSISKREKNKIYYTSIKVKKHEEKHSKLGRPKNFKRNLKKKKKLLRSKIVTLLKKNYIKKTKPERKNPKKERERKLSHSQELIKNIHPLYPIPSPSPSPFFLHPETFFPKERIPKNPLTTRIKEIGNKEKKENKKKKKRNKTRIEPLNTENRAYTG